MYGISLHEGVNNSAIIPCRGCGNALCRGLKYIFKAKSVYLASIGKAEQRSGRALLLMAIYVANDDISAPCSRAEADKRVSRRILLPHKKAALSKRCMALTCVEMLKDNITSF